MAPARISRPDPKYHARLNWKFPSATKFEPARPQSPLKLTLAVALLKGEKFDLVVQKMTELGVVRVIPVITARADVKIAATMTLNAS